MKLCPRCGSLAYYNAYFSSYMCKTCGEMWKEHKKEGASKKSQGYHIKRRLSEKDENISLMA